jgi:hypothetical protein
LAPLVWAPLGHGRRREWNSFKFSFGRHSKFRFGFFSVGIREYGRQIAFIYFVAAAELFITFVVFVWFTVNMTLSAKY